MSFVDPDDIKLEHELLASEWNKNKGIIAKIAGKTGIGEALDELAKAELVVRNKLILGAPFQNKRANSLDDLTSVAEASGKDLLKSTEHLAQIADDLSSKAGVVHKNTKIVG